MDSDGQDHVKAGRSEKNKASATARMIYYAASDANELGLGECGHLLQFVAEMIRMKYDLQEPPTLVRWQEKQRRRQ
jgi:hypothetical protein